MDFHVGDTVILTDGKRNVLRVIDGVRKGHLSIGCLLFDWTGVEVETPYSEKLRIFSLEGSAENAWCVES